MSLPTHDDVRGIVTYLAIHGMTDAADKVAALATSALGPPPPETDAETEAMAATMHAAIWPIVSNGEHPSWPPQNQDYCNRVRQAALNARYVLDQRRVAYPPEQLWYAINSFGEATEKRTRGEPTVCPSAAEALSEGFKAMVAVYRKPK